MQSVVSLYYEFAPIPLNRRPMKKKKIVQSVGFKVNVEIKNKQL